MFIEKRKSGKNIKYYLVHSYRGNGNKVCKIRRYLGSNLPEKKINLLKVRASELILAQIEDMKTEIFSFSLSKKEILHLNRKKISLYHLDKKEWGKFIEQFVYNTNAIEGSTVAENEVGDILRKTKLNNSDEIETKGVAKAIDFIRSAKSDMSLDVIKKIHLLCFNGSKDFAGGFRKDEVVIMNFVGDIIHRGVPAKGLSKDLDGYIRWYKNNKKKFTPLVLAAIMHNQFEHIHPFLDGNGRVGRLLLNFILIKSNYPPINIFLEDRSEYYGALQAYSKNHELKPTLIFLIKQYEKGLKKVTTKKVKKA